jgi:hypothetical protein
VPRRAEPVPDAALHAARRQEGLLTMRQCLAAGMTSRQVTGRVDRKEWERAARGVYDTGIVRPETPSAAYDHRRRRTALLGPLAHPGAAAVGVGALVLRGVRGAPIEFEPEVAVPKARPRLGDGPVRVRRVLVPEPEDVDGILCAPIVDAFALAVPQLGRFDAVAMLDSARHQGLLSDEDLLVARNRTAGRRGTRRSWAWWDESDARAESPAESWVRVSCVDRGCPPDTLQVWIVDRRGGRLARVDMAWALPDGGVLLVEIDGREVHGTPEALVDDRRRQNRIDSRSTVVRRFTGGDARDGTAAAAVQRVLTAARWRPRPLPDHVAYCIERAEFVPKPWS